MCVLVWLYFMFGKTSQIIWSQPFLNILSTAQLKPEFPLQDAAPSPAPSHTHEKEKDVLKDRWFVVGIVSPSSRFGFRKGFLWFLGYRSAGFLSHICPWNGFFATTLRTSLQLPIYCNSSLQRNQFIPVRVRSASPQKWLPPSVRTQSNVCVRLNSRSHLPRLVCKLFRGISECKAFLLNRLMISYCSILKRLKNSYN